MRDHGVPEYERVTLGIRLKELEDVHLPVDMNLKSELVESDALEPKLMSAEAEAKLLGHGDWYARIKTARWGAPQIANWDGYEVVTKKPAQAKADADHTHALLFEERQDFVVEHIGRCDRRLGRV